MRRLLLTMVVMFAAGTSARAELFTGQTLGVGEQENHSGMFTRLGWQIGDVTLNMGGEYVTPLKIHIDEGYAGLWDGSGITHYFPIVAGGPKSFLSPLGFFVCDNVLDFGSPNYLSSYGLLYSDGAIEMNVFIDPSNGLPTILFSSDFPPPPTAACEPSSMAICLPLALALAVRVRRSRRCLVVA